MVMVLVVVMVMVVACDSDSSDRGCREGDAGAVHACHWFVVISLNDDHNIVLRQKLAIPSDDRVGEGELLCLEEQTGADA